MIGHRIHQWIGEGSPYGDGVALYALAYPRRPKLRIYQAQLKRPFISPDMAAQLISELQVLAEAPTQKATPVRSSNASPDKIDAGRGVLDELDAHTEQLPEAVMALRREVKALHKRYDYLRAELRAVPREDSKEYDQQRFEIAAELLQEVQPRIDAIYTQLRAFAKTGRAPDHPQKEAWRGEVADEVFEYYRLHNLAKKKNPDGSPKLNDEQQARLSELRKRYNKHREASYKKHS